MAKVNEANALPVPRDTVLVLALRGLVLAIALVLPLVLDSYLLSLAILILFWGLLGQGWNIMGGYAGQFSFGHAAFYGLGAYTSTWLLVNAGVNPWIGMLAGGLVAVAFGLFTGFLSFRYGLRGPYFALATFAFAEMLRLIAINWEVVNKSRGIQVPLRGTDSLLAFQFETTKVPYYYIILSMVLFTLALTYWIDHSKLGYYFKAIRENEEAAAALGVDPLCYKLLAMSISAFITAMGGTFYSQYLLFIDPEIVFGPQASVEILLRPIIGGAGTVLGPIVGALLLTPLSEFTRTLLREPPGFLVLLRGHAGTDMMVFGALLIVTIIFMPNGLAGWIAKRWNRLVKR
ncbi:MAG: branched-chain amino acid ABC transporter permease [Chloroflexi bacterium]|nr:branched-chain amino acid ABC transporter permease [Chloroflexota bacterium]